MPLNDLNFDDATSIMANPLMFMGMPGGTDLLKNPQAMGQYVQNFERRRAIRQSLYPPGPMSGGRGVHPSGSLAPMPNMGNGYPPGTQAAETAQNLFGVTPPSHINPFLVFNDQDANGNPTFFGRHPLFTRMLEGGMVGATTPPANTAGEGISNISRTVLGMPGMYRANVAAQMNAPVQEAGEIGALQKLHNEIDEQKAQIDLHHAQAGYYNQRDTEPKPPHLQFNNDNEAIQWDPNAPSKTHPGQMGEFVKRDDLSGDPKRAPVHEITARDIVNMKNTERAGKGLPPLTSDESLDIVKQFNSTKAAAHPRAPHIDPNLAFQMKELDKDITFAENDYSNKGGIPSNPIEAAILQNTDPEKYKAALDARNRRDALYKRKEGIMQQHFNYSLAQSDQDLRDNPDDYVIPSPIAPVRVPSPNPVLPPGTVVRTDSGQPGAYSNGRITPAQPGTTRVPKNPFRK